MRGITSAGRTKFEAARDGARAFVGLLRPIDQAAVLSFDRHVTVAAQLTGDRARLWAAIDGIETASWTRIDLALDAARDELTSPRRRPESRAVLVLLTDGQPTHTTTEAVLAAAGRVHAEGITVFTIGLGPDVDAGMLVAVAGAADRYYPAADGEDLVAIYGRISEKIPCD
jgi:Mg-chelatase subunit ChlD